MNIDYSGKLAAQGQGYAGTNAKPPRQPALGALHMAVKLLSEAADSSQSVADRLCGGSAVDGSTGQKIAALPNGIFDEVDCAAEDIENFAHQIMANTRRIGDRL